MLSFVSFVQEVSPVAKLSASCDDHEDNADDDKLVMMMMVIMAVMMLMMMRFGFG